MRDEDVEVLQDLVFRTASQDLSSTLDSWREELSSDYSKASEDRQDEIAQMVCENAIDLQSVLADWGLKENAVVESDGTQKIDQAQLDTETATNYALLSQWGRDDLVKQAKEAVREIEESNLVHLARMGLQGEVNTFWGNDYAVHLREAMRKGACLVTTNPQLINIARQEEPDRWTPVRNQMREENPDMDALQLAYEMTIAVVVANCKLLRPIWELTDERIGYVSLQLNPKNSDDADSMIEQANYVWPRLEEALGGIPNTVFKVPGTKAGLTAAAELTSNRMGVNITVNYSLPQQIAFGSVIEKNSIAPVSFRTQMDGRLDDPVGEELQEADVSDWEEVKTWCTTAIRQREYRLLCMDPMRGGMGLKKTNMLPASGRGAWNISRSIHREPEVSCFITIFPDKQELFDSEPRELNPDGMWTPVPSGIMEKLYKSELFRKAYEPDGMTVDEFDDFLPCVRTLKGFSESFDEFVDWVAG